MSGGDEGTPDLAQIREACDKATPGPWTYEDSWGKALAADVLILGEPGTGFDDTYHALLREPPRKQSNTRYDLAFMAASREWVPALVAELEAARTELAEVADAIWDACWKGTELPVRDNCRLCHCPGPDLVDHYGECPGRFARARLGVQYE